MTKPLENKIALVTGAARGIGQAIALQLAADGADLALCDVKAEWLEDTAAKVKALGRRAESYAMDVANGAAVGEAVAQVLADFGRIDVLVNNAGITRDTLLMRMSEEDWDAVLDINLKGAFLVTKAVVKPMMKQRSGAIVNIASVVGIMGNPGQANYTASKAGLIALTKTTAKELGSRNIRVNAVAPGGTGQGSHAQDGPAGPAGRAGGRRQGRGLPGQRGRRLREWPDLGRVRRHGVVILKEEQQRRNTMALADKVKDIIVEQLGVNKDQVVPEASFIEDQGADSLDTVELVMAFEEEFGAEIPDEDAEKLTTVGAVINYLKEKGFDK